MFYRANPGMTSLPCFCKDIYSRNATEELLQEDKNYDRYGRLGCTNILYSVKETNLAKPKSPEIGSSKVFNQLTLRPESKPPVFDFELLEMSSWSACATLRKSHKTCGLLSETELDINESSKSENQIQRHSVSSLEASVNSKKKVKCESNHGSVRPYSDSKLNQNSRKPSTFTFKKTFTFEENYKFYHFKDFARYIGGYTDTVTLPRLQEHYRIHRRGNARAMTTRQQRISHNALRSRKDKNVRKVPATNAKLVSRDSSINNTSHEQARNETYYNIHFLSFPETCSFKVARCCVHAENRRERIPRTHRDDKVKEEGSGVDDNIQMFCDRLSTTNCGKDERRRSHRKSSKILQKSEIRKLEIVTRPPNATTPGKKPSPTTTPGKKPSLTAITQPSRWQESMKFGRSFPSPRMVSGISLVTKPAQFQDRIAATKTTADESSNTQKVFPENESDVIDGND